MNPTSIANLLEQMAPDPRGRAAAGDRRRSSYAAQFRARLAKGKGTSRQILEPRFAKLSVRDRRRKWRNKGELQRFIASFSKTRLFFSKHFQRKLWRFCGISRGCKGSKSNRSISKFLRRASLLSASFPTPYAAFRQSRRRGTRAFSGQGGRVHGGVLGAGDTGTGEFLLSTDSDLRKEKAATI